MIVVSFLMRFCSEEGKEGSDGKEGKVGEVGGVGEVGEEGEEGEEGKEGKEGKGKEGEGKEEERSTISPDTSNTEDDWFALISAHADWTNIHVYTPPSDSGSDSDADSDTNSDTNSNSGVDLDLNSGAGSGSNLNIFAPTRPEDDIWNYSYLDFGNILEPVTPQQPAFRISGVPDAVHFVSVFVLTIFSHTSIRQLPHLRPFIHHMWVSTRSFSLKYQTSLTPGCDDNEERSSPPPSSDSSDSSPDNSTQSFTGEPHRDYHPLLTGQSFTIHCINERSDFLR